MDFTEINCNVIGRTVINGKVYENISGNVVINDKGIYVNGQPLEEYEQLPLYKIEIYGDVNTISSENASIDVNGNVGSISTKNGNVTCKDVSGNVETKNGNVHCGKVGGDVLTKNGNINRW